MRTRKLSAIVATVATTAAIALGASACSSDKESKAADAAPTSSLPRAGSGAATAVLVHGAFADSSSWDGTVAALQGAGYDAVAFAEPLRGVANDAKALKAFIDTIDGPIVLVGHSYAGMVISQVAAEDHDVKGLVYVAAFIPEVGESVNTLNSKYKGSELVPDNLHFAPAPGGLTDVYINASAYATVYAGGLDKAAASIAAATQRPIAAEALGEAATTAAPDATPKWSIVASEDHAVPTAIQKFMSKRAGAKVTTVASGHDVPAAQPVAVAKVIAQAAG